LGVSTQGQPAGGAARWTLNQTAAWHRPATASSPRACGEYGVVEFLLRHSRRSGDLRGHCLESLSLGHPFPHLVDEVRDLHCRRGRPREYDGDLAAHPLGGPVTKLVEFPAPDLLVGFGQLPTDHDRAFTTEGLDRCSQRGFQSVRRFEKYGGPWFGGESAQPPAAFTGVAWGEAVEAD